MDTELRHPAHLISTGIRSSETCHRLWVGRLADGMALQTRCIALMIRGGLSRVPLFCLVGKPPGAESGDQSHAVQSGCAAGLSTIARKAKHQRQPALPPWCHTPPTAFVFAGEPGKS